MLVVTECKTVADNYRHGWTDHLKISKMGKSNIRLAASTYFCYMANIKS